MGFFAKLFSATSTLGASSFDIGSDLINSLDFLGYNISRTISDTLSSSFHTLEEDRNLTFLDIINGTSTIRSLENYEKHAIWGFLGISIIFLPGIIAIPPIMYYAMNNQKHHSVIYFFGLLFYPITLILISFGSVCRSFGGRGTLLIETSMMMVGNEAFFESFPQILLQCFTICYGYEVTTVQKVAIFASFVMLARIAIVYDLLMQQKELSFKGTMIHTIKILPAHVTTIIFRVFAFTLEMVFLRGWATIPIFVLYLEMLVITYVRYKNVKDPGNRFMSFWLVPISNLAVLSVYNIGDMTMDKKDEPSKESSRRFIRLSSIITFVHHSMVLVSIILLSLHHPDYLQQAQFERLILKPGGCHFFYAFGVTLSLGFYSLVLCLYLSKKVLVVKDEDK